ncbi:hypothetical protein BWQ96_09161 [Gracilariopsis chorda]|uniref:Uncharacterized protein n=1 Tax=Gracilariopsis chorda TaxID=448386 RepID=A0A2V3IGD0_9FLOR|nr:hypothetical protein BWQ96_09161 [Gracilariopsis chorda]|eukprot:PXF41129.1 hypothetical protein BWQ96_09161 [Gracilariopsis chorda]
MSVDSEVSFRDLPNEAVERIVTWALGITKERALTPDATTLKTAVQLSRTNNSLRRATAHAIQALHFEQGTPLWPSVKILGPHISDSVRVVNVTVDRSAMFGFLKWLLPAQDVAELTLNVVGEPYAQERMTQLEKMLLGRLFTNTGASLRSLKVSGVNCQSLLFTSLFKCTQLREIHIEDYGEASGATLLNVFTLVLLANRGHLKEVNAPLNIWKSRMSAVPDGDSFAKGCEMTWNTVWVGYLAGVKESVLNLKAGENELVNRVESAVSNMDDLEQWMRDGLSQLRDNAKGVGSESMPESVLGRLVPLGRDLRTKVLE